MKKVFTAETLGDHVTKAKYDLTGKVLKRAREIMALKDKGESVPFTKLTKMHFGNPPALGKKPLTFVRQVIAAAMYPEVTGVPEDAKKRAKHYIDNVDQGALAAYNDGAGFPVMRKSVAKYIEKRDGHPSDVDSIWLANGATEAMDIMLTMMINGPQDGVFIPVPEYPAYSYLVTQKKGTRIPYLLDESNDWGLDMKNLAENYDEAVKKGVTPKVIVVINPGNPTGAVFSRENIENVIKFCSEKKMVIISDEVYQENLYEATFISFKKVLMELPAPYNQVELASVHSAAKGAIGECGLRGGYVEFANFDKSFLDFYDTSRDLGAVNVVGSIAIEVMCNPPTKGVEAPEVVALWEKERAEVFENYSAKAKILTERINKTPHLSTRRMAGAMWAFPRIEMTASATKAAAEKGYAPDELYCIELVERTGIVLVPGTAFGEAPGTSHFRISNLLWDVKEYEGVLDKISEFTKDFFTRYP